MKTKSFRKEKVQLITLGCSKNLVDSENLITQLEHNDYRVEHNAEDSPVADIVIINTCGFIDRAKEESIETILTYAGLKRTGDLSKLYVTGCLSQRYKDQLEEEIPEVDEYFGTMEMPALLARLQADYRQELIGERMITTPTHYAYLKISEGCNRTCSFCAIPLMRGKHISVPVEQLVDQARHLARNGVREIMLIAQELTYYGLDLYKRRALPELLDRLCEVEGIEWIRLHYAYPSKFPMEVIEVMNRQSKICNYLDMPLQHGADRVLKAMQRQIGRQESLELIARIREIIPDICLRTTMLVGFPGETEEDFEELCDFVRQVGFDRLGVFEYSHEEDTGAYGLEDDVPQDIKTQRASALMQIQESISLEKNRRKIGNRLRVLVDRKEGEYYVARSEHDSPEVDNEVLIRHEGYIRTGDFVNVEVTDCTEFDLFAVLVED